MQGALASLPLLKLSHNWPGVVVDRRRKRARRAPYYQRLLMRIMYIMLNYVQGNPR